MTEPSTLIIQLEAENLTLIKRVKHLERKLRTIKNLTEGKHGPEGIHYLAESALKEGESKSKDYIVNSSSTNSP